MRSCALHDGEADGPNSRAALLLALAAGAALAWAVPHTARGEDDALPRRGELPFETLTLFNERQLAEWGTDFGVYTWEVAKAAPGSRMHAIYNQRVLVSIDGTDLRTMEHFAQALRGRKPGDKLRCEFVLSPGTEHGHYFEAVELVPRPFETSPDLDITYGSVLSNGIRLRTIVTRPRQAGRLPALLYIERDGRFPIDYPLWTDGVFRGFLEAIARAGFVVMRVARPGTDDSEGASFRDCRFEDDLHGFRQALRQLRSFDFVDSDKAFILGRYSGGVLAGLLAAENRPAGVITYGTGLRVTHCPMTSTARGAWFRGDRDYAEARRLVEGEHVFLRELLSEGRSPEQIREKHAELELHVQHYLKSPNELYDRGVDYLRTLYRIDAEALWKSVQSPVLVLWGKADWANPDANPSGIVACVNAASPGRARLIEFDHVNNEFSRCFSPEASFDQYLDIQYDPVVVETVIEWLSREAKR